VLVIILKNSIFRSSYFKGAHKTLKLEEAGEKGNYQLQENVVKVLIRNKYRQKI
jgi:hypothetical protein